MKSVLLLTLLSGAAALQAQTPAAPAAPAPGEKPKLSEAQVSKVLSELKTLEQTILAQRGNTLAAVLKEINDALASDQAAVTFYTKCDVEVNSARKEDSKSEQRQRAEQVKGNMERKGKGGGNADDEEGDQGLAIRLGLKYLALTLEAHETKDDDFKKMVPKLQAYIQDLVANSEKLKGRAMGMVSRVGGPNSPVVAAYQLDRYLNREHWSRNGTDFGSMYEATILHVAETESPEKLPELYTARINAEAAFRKSQMAEPEYRLWLASEYPALNWDRAVYLYEKGPSAITALGEMLNLIRNTPGHPDAPQWVAKLRTLINESSAVPPTSDPAAATAPGVTGSN